MILMCKDLLDPQNAKKSKAYSQIFEFPAKTRVNMLRKINKLGTSSS